MDINWKIIQESETHYYCVICGCPISGSRNVQEHFRGRRHENAIEVYGGDISYSGNNQYYCQLCDCNISGYQNVRTHLKGNRHQDLLDGSDTETSDDSEDYVALSSRDFIISYRDCNMFYCCLCNCNIANTWELSLHLGRQRHITAFRIYGSDILGNGSTWYYCRLCDCPLSSYKSIFKHIVGERHQDFLDESE